MAASAGPLAVALCDPAPLCRPVDAACGLGCWPPVLRGGPTYCVATLARPLGPRTRLGGFAHRRMPRGTTVETGGTSWPGLAPVTPASQRALTVTEVSPLRRSDVFGVPQVREGATS